MSTDNKFKWTDFQVAEFAGFVKSKNKEGEYDIQVIMDQYKNDHAPKEHFNWVVFTKEGFGYDTWEPTDWRGDKGSNWDESVKTFAGLREANEFVIMNIPCLSITDVKTAYAKDRSFVGVDFLINGLRELVQSKHQGG